MYTENIENQNSKKSIPFWAFFIASNLCFGLSIYIEVISKSFLFPFTVFVIGLLSFVFGVRWLGHHKGSIGFYLGLLFTVGIGFCAGIWVIFVRILSSAANSS